MKKFLSLVLALVMTMSLVTISAGAKDFTDGEDINYNEAIDVMSALKVVEGYPDESFKPQNILTRAEAAKIICNLILGPTTASALKADTAPFKDVPADHWAAGFIAYCANQGIINGYGNGVFGVNDNLDGSSFMKMLLCALGYDAEIEGFVGGNWSINVAKQAIGIGLDKGLTEEFDGGDDVTREEACLYALNTLKATLVDYDTKTTVNVGDASVTIAGTTAKPVAWNNSNVQTGIKNDGNIDGDGFVQFAEQYFTKLTLTPDQDVFGRPSRTWDYKGEEVGTYVNYDLLVKEYTDEVTGKDLYDELGKTTIDDYDVAVYIDGEDDATVNTAVFNKTQMNKNNKKGVGETDKGVLTQVFVDTDSEDITIVVINTFLAKAKADYNEKKDEASFTVYAIDKKAAGVYVKTLTDGVEDKETMTVSAEDFAIAADVEEDEFYLVRVAEGDIQAIEKAEIVPDATLTAFKVGSNVVADGETYKYAGTAEYDVEVLDNYTGISTAINLKEKTYNIILDQYGYLIGVELVKAEDNYVFITGIDTNTSNLFAKNNDASAIFLDGTMKTITYNTTKSDALTATYDALVNTWCTYTVDKDGVYTLKKVNDTTGINTTAGVKIAQKHDITSTDIDKKHVSLTGIGTDGYTKVYGNDSTVYLTGKVKTITTVADGKCGIIADVTNVITGVDSTSVELYDLAEATVEANKNAKLATTTTLTDAAYGAYTLYKSNGYIIATVVIGKDSKSSENLVYVTSSSVEQEAYDSATDEWTWTRKVALDGTETLLKEVGDGLSKLNGLKQYNWYVVSYNGKGEVIDATLASTDLTGNEYVDTLTAIETAVNDKTTVLFEAADKVNGTQVNKDMNNMSKQPYLKGNTFYVNTNNNTGFRVAEDVKIVFIQTNDRKTTTTWDEGVKNLEDVVADLNASKTTGNYDYDVSAILKDGAAKVVIIRDQNDATGNAGNNTPTTTTGYAPVSWDGTALRLRYHGTPMTDEQIKAAIGALLGSPVEKMNKVIGTVTLANGDVYPVNFTQIEVFYLYIDGVVKQVKDSGVSWANVTGLTNGVKYVNTANGNDQTVSSNTMTMVGTATADINYVTGYTVTMGSKASAKWKLSDGTEMSISASGNDVVPNGTVLAVTGTETTIYRQFTADGEGFGAITKNSTAATTTYVVNAAVTIDEANGYKVTIDGTEMGVFEEDDVVYFTAPFDGAVYKLNATTDTTVTIDTLGTAYAYTVKAADATAGDIKLDQYVEVEFTVVTVKAGTTDLTDGDFVKVGTALTVKATSLAADKHIQAAVNGGSAANVSAAGTGADLTITYTVTAQQANVTFSVEA